MTTTRWQSIHVHRFCFLVAVALATTALPAKAGPFGFEMGMTVKQVQTLVKLPPPDARGGFVLKTAPKPHRAFESYYLIFSPKTGLAKIGAAGKDITVTGAGHALRTAFESMEKSLSAKYGRSERQDKIDSRSVWNGPGDWMQALLKEERVLLAFWNGSEGQLPDNLQVIFLEAKALSPSAGYLMLYYEFSNFNELKDAADEAL